MVGKLLLFKLNEVFFEPHRLTVEFKEARLKFKQAIFLITRNPFNEFY
jgi:hypothetical protein